MLEVERIQSLAQSFSPQELFAALVWQCRSNVRSHNSVVIDLVTGTGPRVMAIDYNVTLLYLSKNLTEKVDRVLQRPNKTIDFLVGIVEIEARTGRGLNP